MVLVTRRPHARRPPQHSRRLSRDVPQFVSEPLSERIGSPVVVKAATTANPIGCFKGCGTWLAVANLAGEVGERQGVIVASAGNFGLGVAYACRALGVPAVVVMAATTANPAMVDAMRRLGAEVRLAGEDFDVARAAAAALALQTGQQLLVDGQDPWMAIGAGTIALELTDGIERDEPPCALRDLCSGRQRVADRRHRHLDAARSAIQQSHWCTGRTRSRHDPLVEGRSRDRDRAS